MVIAIIITVELGMRFTIYHSLNEVVPENAKYKTYIYMDTRISPSTCFVDYRNNYLYVFYSVWILIRMRANSVCYYKTPHITLIIDMRNNKSIYHWSFHSLEFIKDER